MEIKDKWVVHEIRDNLYFTGMNHENYPVLESLNSKVRQYNSKRAAECAIRRIEESGIECCEFIAEYIKLEEIPDVSDDTAPGETCDLYDELHKLCDKYNVSFDSESQGLGAELADLARKYRKNIPDVPADKPSDPPKMTVAENESEWTTVFVCAAPPREPGGTATFSKIALCRKQIGDREIFGVRALDGKLYSAGFDGGETALKRFLEEYYNYLLKRVTRGEKTLPLPCPICGKTHRENGSWAQCPKYKTSVCHEHCYKCEHFTDFGGTSIVRCLFPEKA